MMGHHVPGDPGDSFLAFLEKAASATTGQKSTEWDAQGGDQRGSHMPPPNDRLCVVDSGFQSTAVNLLLAEWGLHREIKALIDLLRTIDHQSQDGEWSRGEINIAFRVARLLPYAERTLGSRKRAFAWLRRPNRAFGNAVPLMLLATEAGGHRVADLLLRADYGQMA
jgi:putative toxin-antitoxin system antitoxin component (TIGR02293 family)